MPLYMIFSSKDRMWWEVHIWLEHKINQLNTHCSPIWFETILPIYNLKCIQHKDLENNLPVEPENCNNLCSWVLTALMQPIWCTPLPVANKNVSKNKPLFLLMQHSIKQGPRSSQLLISHSLIRFGSLALTALCSWSDALHSQWHKNVSNKQGR